MEIPSGAIVVGKFNLVGFLVTLGLAALIFWLITRMFKSEVSIYDETGAFIGKGVLNTQIKKPSMPVSQTNSSPPAAAAV